MAHLRNSLSLRTADRIALAHARHLAATVDGVRLDEGDGDDEGDEGESDEEGEEGDEGEGDDEGDEGESDDEGEGGEAEKWRKLSRKHESRSKQNLKRAQQAERELDELRRSQLPDQERAIAEARAEARAEALREFGAKLVDAEIRAAAAGRLSATQVDALLESLDRTRFLDDDGDVDTDTVQSFVDGIAPPEGAPGTGKKAKDLGQGRRNGKPKPTVAAGRDLYQQRHGNKST